MIRSTPGVLDFTQPQLPALFTAVLEGSGEGNLNLVGGDYEVDWGDGSFLPYADGVDAVSNILGTVNVRSVNVITQFQLKLTGFTDLDITKSDTLTTAFEMCKNHSTLTSFAIADASNITNMEGMFTTCTGLLSLPLFDTSSVTSMIRAFNNAGFTSLPLFNTANVASFAFAFTNSASLITIPAFDYSSNESFQQCFEGCTGLEYLPVMLTSNVLFWNSTFKDCSSLVCIGGLDTTGSDFTSALMWENNPALVAPDATEQTALENNALYTNASPCP